MTYTLIEITNLLNLNVQETCYMLSIKNKMDIYDTDCRLWVHNLHTKLRHCLSLHFCLILFGPPNFFMSCQNIKIPVCIMQPKGENSFNTRQFLDGLTCMQNTNEIKYMYVYIKTMCAAMK